MSSNIIELPALDYFGSCPKCRRNDGCYNIGPEHWFVCEKHRFKWCEGSNLFSGWREETEANWRANYRRLEGYQEVIPLYPPIPESDPDDEIPF